MIVMKQTNMASYLKQENYQDISLIAMKFSEAFLTDCMEGYCPLLLLMMREKLILLLLYTFYFFLEEAFVLIFQGFIFQIRGVSEVESLTVHLLFRF